MCKANTKDDYADVSVENYEAEETTATESCDPCVGCSAKGSYCKECPYQYGN